LKRERKKGEKKKKTGGLLGETRKGDRGTLTRTGRRKTSKEGGQGEVPKRESFIIRKRGSKRGKKGPSPTA